MGLKAKKKKGRSRKSTQSTARTASDHQVEESTAGKKWEENDLLVLVAARKDDMTKYSEACA